MGDIASSSLLMELSHTVRLQSIMVFRRCLPFISSLAANVKSCKINDIMFTYKPTSVDVLIQRILIWAKLYSVFNTIICPRRIRMSLFDSKCHVVNCLWTSHCFWSDHYTVESEYCLIKINHLSLIDVADSRERVGGCHLVQYRVCKYRHQIPINVSVSHVSRFIPLRAYRFAVQHHIIFQVVQWLWFQRFPSFCRSLHIKRYSVLRYHHRVHQWIESNQTHSNKQGILILILIHNHHCICLLHHHL